MAQFGERKGDGVPQQGWRLPPACDPGRKIKAKTKQNKNKTPLWGHPNLDLSFPSLSTKRTPSSRRTAVGPSMCRERTPSLARGRGAQEALLVVGRAAFPFAVTIHATGAEGAGEQVGGARGHEVTDCRRNVHSLVSHRRSGTCKGLRLQTKWKRAALCPRTGSQVHTT